MYYALDNEGKIIGRFSRPQQGFDTVFIEDDAPDRNYMRVDGEWIECTIPATDAEVRHALQQEADPLFFKWQRGESTEQDWLDKVAEVKERFN